MLFEKYSTAEGEEQVQYEKIVALWTSTRIGRQDLKSNQSTTDLYKKMEREYFDYLHTFSGDSIHFETEKRRLVRHIFANVHNVPLSEQLSLTAATINELTPKFAEETNLIRALNTQYRHFMGEHEKDVQRATLFSVYEGTKRRWIFDGVLFEAYNYNPINREILTEFENKYPFISMPFQQMRLKLERHWIKQLINAC
jgi:hypothetical protein